MAIKNYKYRCWPDDGGRRALDQMQAGHTYRNQLVELELDRRKDVEQILSTLCPTYLALRDALAAKTAEVEAAIAVIAAARARARSKGVDCKDAKQRIKEERAKLKSVRDAFRAAKREALDRDDVRAELAASSAAHQSRAREARAKTTAHWGTYLVVEDAAKDFGKGAPPRFDRWNGRGTIAVQIQGGLQADEIYAGADRRLQINRRCGGNAQDYTLAIRTGSEGRDPVWSMFRIRMERPLPAGSTIKWCKVIRSVLGTQVRYHAIFTLEMVEPQRFAPQSLCAVHAGYRMIGGYLRVATWRGSDGDSGEVYLDDRDLGTLAHLDSLQSIRDQWRDTAIRRVKRWSAAATKRGIVLPDWLTKILPHLHAWKSHQRLRDLAERWDASGFEGDDKISRYLSWWRVRKDRHLHNWIANRRDRLIRSRNDRYRVLAARLSAKYQHVSVIKVDWKSLSEKSEVGYDEDDAPAIVRRYARFASPATLHQYLSEKFREDYLAHDPNLVTQTCHVCQHVNDWDTKNSVQQTCGLCGRSVDIDYNAVLNQLEKGEAEIKSRSSLAVQSGQEVAPDSELPRFSARQQRFRAARERRTKLKKENAIE